MRIDIRSCIPDPGGALLVHAERRLRFAMGRFGARVVRASLRLADGRGLRGGTGAWCRLAVGLASGRSVLVETRDESATVAVDRATDRVGHAVARELAWVRGLP